jgi:hypothetical protein
LSPAEPSTAVGGYQTRRAAPASFGSGGACQGGQDQSLPGLPTAQANTATLEYRRFTSGPRDERGDRRRNHRPSGRSPHAAARQVRRPRPPSVRRPHHHPRPSGRCGGRRPAGCRAARASVDRLVVLRRVGQPGEAGLHPSPRRALRQNRPVQGGPGTSWPVSPGPSRARARKAADEAFSAATYRTCSWPSAQSSRNQSGICAMNASTPVQGGRDVGTFPSDRQRSLNRPTLTLRSGRHARSP